MILPTVILPGYFAGWRDYTPLSQLLQQQGIPTAIVPLVKRDWLPTVGGRSMVPILRVLHQTVEQILAKEGGGQVNLIGHSAWGMDWTDLPRGATLLYPRRCGQTR